uniref:Endonuclease n=1 Tax=Pithovirus LCPAC401 TaxID=2506595 RepID=A0A481ZBL9_9VIRU|nr:MAG: endonuclease [Pithovirus LCPAC401]
MSSKYNNYCATCFVELFPNDPRSKTVPLPNKELKVRQYLNENFPDRFIYGKQLFIADREKRCTSFNRCIDAQTEFDDYILAIEVDENQHKWYDLMDEELRIMQIYQNAGKNLIFIRFNPDKYVVNGETKNPQMPKRYEVLKNKINEIIDKISHSYKFDSWYTEIKLFFDEGETKLDTSIRCVGFSKKAQRRCLNKVSKEGELCFKHKTKS